MSNQTEQYDVIIVGGGMVGASFACALADSQLKIALVENVQAPTWTQADHDLRVSAITQASECFLRNIGVWEGIVARRISPFREMHVWDGSGSGVIHFDSAHIGEATLGHIIENSVIQLAALERLAEMKNVHYIAPVEAAAMNVEDDRVVLSLSDGRILEAKLIVGADGSRSWVRQQANIDVKGWSYHQKAVVTTVKTAIHHNETAWQRFLPDGPLAFLPLTDGYSSIVWSATTQRADALLALNDVDFMAELKSAFDGKLGDIESVSARGAFPLKLQHATRYVGERTVLIGDAAHTVHPLAGQGVNLGFMDAAALAEVLIDATEKYKTSHVDFAAHRVLRRYERWRKTDTLATLAAMDMFKRLFGHRSPAVRWARNTGLTLTHQAEPIKNIIMRHTMGLSGDLPALAKPSYVNKVAV
jgi:2-octaprenylphenol hydroxylase